MRWRERARYEIALAKRSWMVTLTFSPIHLAGVLLAAKRPDARLIERSAYAEVQKFFKRLRKNHPAAKFRYLAVYERGEVTGRSHYHVLIHEVGSRPVLKMHLESAWASHVHARLVDKEGDGAPSYVTKYLTKSLDTPPRASARYGVARSVIVSKKKKTHRPFFHDNVTLTSRGPTPLLVWSKSDFVRCATWGDKRNGGWNSDECARYARRRFIQFEEGWCTQTDLARKRKWVPQYYSPEEDLLSGQYEQASGC